MFSEEFVFCAPVRSSSVAKTIITNELIEQFAVLNGAQVSQKKKSRKDINTPESEISKDSIINLLMKGHDVIVMALFSQLPC